MLQAVKSAENPAKAFDKIKSNLTDIRKEILDKEVYLCQVDLKMIGGLVMPVILKLEYQDGSSEEVRIPAEIWKMQNELLENSVSKVLVTNKSVKKVVLDPNLETADTDVSNNAWPR
jgi:hypothetical protein